MTRKTVNDIVSDDATRDIIAARFWTKVSRAGADECWLWQAKSRHIIGYGVMNHKGRTFNSHVISWALANGTIPDGGQVLHKCDVPGCCNPRHLYVGDNIQNRRDSVERGRQRKGPHKPETIAKIKAAVAGKPRVLSDEGREAIRRNMKERWSSPEWRKHWSETMSGENNPLYGKKPSEARMRAVIEACRRRKGEKRSEETKQKMRDAARRRRERRQEQP